MFFLIEKKITSKLNFKNIILLMMVMIIFSLIYFDNKDNHPGIPNIIIVFLTSIIIIIKSKII